MQLYHHVLLLQTKDLSHGEAENFWGNLGNLYFSPGKYICIAVEECIA